jgi:hypothetical protein
VHGDSRHLRMFHGSRAAAASRAHDVFAVDGRVQSKELQHHGRWSQPAEHFH